MSALAVRIYRYVCSLLTLSITNSGMCSDKNNFNLMEYFGKYCLSGVKSCVKFSHHIYRE